MPDLERGLSFYRDLLGHELLWRTATAAGLRLPDTDAELVLQTERPEFEANLLVENVENALQTLILSGARLLWPPFDIQVGRCAVVLDPWGNRLAPLDLSQGLLATDALGNVISGHSEGGDAP